MHRDSKTIFESYQSGVQNRVTSNFGSSEVIDGFAKVFLNLDKAEIIALSKALKDMLPSNELTQLLGGLARHPSLKDKMPEIREAGKMLGDYKRETEDDSVTVPPHVLNRMDLKKGINVPPSALNRMNLD